MYQTNLLRDFFVEFRTPESESERNLTNYFIILLLLFVTFLLRIFWKIFFMIIDLNLFQIFEDYNETINNITLWPLRPPPPPPHKNFFWKYFAYLVCFGVRFRLSDI